MTDSRIVVINSSTATPATKAGDYRTTLIIDTHFDSLSRVRVFAPGEQTAIPAGTPLRNALDAAFSTTIKPAIVRVGKSKGVASYSPLSVTSGDQYGFTLTVSSNGVTTSQTETYTASVAETAEDVVDNLKTQFDLVTAITDVVTLAVVGTGEDAVLTVTLDTITDDFSLTSFTGPYSLTGSTTEPAQDTVDGIVDQTNDFSFVVSTNHDPAYQRALGSIIDTYDRKKYFTSTELADAYATWDGVSVPGANDVGADAAFNQYERVHVRYDNDADTKFPELRMISRFTELEPGRQNWQFEPLPSMPLAQKVDLSSPLTTSDQLNLKSKYMSTTISLGGVFVSGGYEGSGNRMANGTRIEVIWWTDYAVGQIKQRWETLLLRSKKMGMNRFDIARFRNVANAWLANEASTVGRTAALDPDNPPVIVMPSPNEIDYIDKVSGALKNINITAYYDPSIDSVRSNFVVTFFDPATEG